ncbi:MAG: formylglycine-generating enzyme family protein [Symploca sp. SIO1B1]|nr:formylglycine-generating enzyme family protein [Symploca sp. SIO1B1]
MIHYPLANLPCFPFELVTVDAQGKETSRYTQQAQFFPEDLGNGVILEMVKIPSGTFLMGSPAMEEGNTGYESPQHQVTVKSFFMGKYPITQAQWQVVAALPKISTKLELHPSHFEGANRPVEKVSWYDAVEFCNRLSRKTGRQYRLPSEAEWEYACRAGTTTPFHFGETITTDLANYQGTDLSVDRTDWDTEEIDWDIDETLYKGSYGQGSLGIYRQETTPVGSFGVANDFGLYDMHGNVSEWCADHWHSDYRGAPQDGSAWKSNKYYSRLLRGGSWCSFPASCRSGFRSNDDPGSLRVFSIGFRVLCEAA